MASFLLGAVAVHGKSIMNWGATNSPQSAPTKREASPLTDGLSEACPALGSQGSQGGLGILRIFLGCLCLLLTPAHHGAVVSRPDPPWLLTLLPEPAPERPVIRRLPFSTTPVPAGTSASLPICFRAAGFTGTAQLRVVLTNRWAGPAAQIVQQTTLIDGSTFQGMIGPAETVAIPSTAIPGWYSVWVSLEAAGGPLNCITSVGVTEIGSGVFEVGSVLITHPLGAKATSLWSFNEPTGAREFVDQLGNRWPLFMTETKLPESGVASPFGRALRFPGGEKEGRSLVIPWQLSPSPAFTLAFWFNLQKGAFLTTILGSGVYARDGLKMGMVTRGSNLLAAAWTTQSGGTLELISTNIIRTNEWHHLALSYDGSVATLFVNGRRGPQQSSPRIIPPASRPLTFWGGTITNEVTFQGLIDEFLIASAALSEAEIAPLVQSYRSGGNFVANVGSPSPVLLSIPDQRVRAGRTLSLRLPIFDADYDIRSLTSDSLPSGAVLDPAKLTFYWNPGFNQTGQHTAAILVTDQTGHTNRASFRIEVLPAPQPSPTNLFIYSIPSPNYPRNQPELIRIAAANADGLVREGERVVLEHASNTVARVRVISLRGQEMYHGGFGLLPPLPTGHYFIETEGDRHHLVVLPKDYQGSSFFGTMGDLPGHYEALTRSAILRAGWRRLGTTISWANIESTRGTYNWSKYDPWITANRTNGGKVIVYLVDDLPAWLRGASETTVITELKRYTLDYVRRNKTKFDVLEPFNEPSLAPLKLGAIKTLTNNVRLAGQFLARAYAEVAAVVRAEMGSTAQLAGPTWENVVGPLDRMQAIMGAAGFSNSVTLGDIHDYVLGLRPPDGRPPPRLFNLPQSANIVRQNTGNVPFFITEIGLHGQSALGYASDPEAVANEPYGEAGISWSLGFRRTLVSMIMYHGAGATSVLAHDFNIGAPLEMGGLEPAPGSQSRGFKPQATAHIMAGYWLDRSAPVLQFERRERLFVYAVQRPAGESLVFAWAPESQNVPIDAARAADLLRSGTVKSHDLFNREFLPRQFTEEPVLFRSSTLNPTQLAQAVLTLETESCNGIVERPAEDCDCNDVGTETTASLGYGTGTLACVSNRFDFTGSQFTHPQTLLTARFPLDELSGTTVQDLSDRRVPALLETPFLSRSWVTSTRGRVLHFEGMPTNVPKEFLRISNTNFSVLPAAGRPFTLALWVKMGTRNPTNWMCLIGSGQYAVNGFRLGVIDTGQVGWWTTQGRGDIELFSPTALSPGFWHHLAVTYDPTGARLYVDGAIAAERWEQAYVPSSADILVGHGFIGDGVDPWRGEIDDLRFYSRALTREEIARLAAGL